MTSTSIAAFDIANLSILARHTRTSGGSWLSSITWFPVFARTARFTWHTRWAIAVRFAARLSCIVYYDCFKKYPMKIVNTVASPEVSYAIFHFRLLSIHHLSTKKSHFILHSNLWMLFFSICSRQRCTTSLIDSETASTWISGISRFTRGSLLARFALARRRIFAWFSRRTWLAHLA